MRRLAPAALFAWALCALAPHPSPAATAATVDSLLTAPGDSVGVAPDTARAAAPDTAGAAAPDTARAAAPDSARATIGTFGSDASIDSLNSYWRNLDNGWYTPLTREALQTELSVTALDSLTGKGDRELAAIARGERWRTSIDPLGRLAFNRVEGWRPGATFTLQRLGRFQPRLVLGAGYGISRRRIVADGKLTLPLRAARPRPADQQALETGRVPPRPWQTLALELSAETAVQPFGGAAGVTHSINSMASGSDRNSYFLRDAFLAELVWRPWPALGLRGGGTFERHLPLPLGTTWSFGGNRRGVGPNVPIPPFATRGAVAALDWRWRRLDGWLRHEWHWTTGGPALGTLPDGNAIPGSSGAPLRRLTGGLRGIWIDAHGNECEVKATGWSFDRQPPLEWRTFLGGSQMLRGYPAQELAGDRAALASLDLRLGADPFRAIRAPLLKNLGLQPIVFADWGWTSALDGPRTFTDLTGATGWRADAGVGIGKLIGISGMGGWLRFYFAHPVLGGQADRSWQIQFELEG